MNDERTAENEMQKGGARAGITSSIVLDRDKVGATRSRVWHLYRSHAKPSHLRRYDLRSSIKLNRHVNIRHLHRLPTRYCEFCTAVMFWTARQELHWGDGSVLHKRDRPERGVWEPSSFGFQGCGRHLSTMRFTNVCLMLDVLGDV